MTDEARGNERESASRVRTTLREHGVEAGLCADCVRVALQTGPHALYVRCLLASTDPRFPRYPRLPVISCPGYAPSVADE